MNTVTIDEDITLELASSFEELSNDALHQIMKLISLPSTVINLKIGITNILLLDSKSLTDTKTKAAFNKLVKTKYRAPVKNHALPFEKQAKTLASSYTTMFHYIVGEMMPCANWLYDFIIDKSNYYFPTYNNAKPINLDEVNLETFIQILNNITDPTEQSKASVYEIVYNCKSTDKHVINYTFINVLKWYNSFTAHFPLLFPKPKPKKDTDELPEQSAKPIDWNNLIVYHLPPEHFGRISDRMKAPAYDVFYYLNAELAKPRNK